MPLIAAALPAFLASLVEFVEAFTIVLAVGSTRGWRAPIFGAIAAVVALAVLVAIFGLTIVTVIDEHILQFVIGALLLLFGLRWLRKAILRYAGFIPFHDEELIYVREVAELRAQGLRKTEFDWIGFLASFKATLLEGLEVVFIVITIGSVDDSLGVAILGASVAFVLVAIVGAFVRRPLSMVPENTLKYSVGVVLSGFGVFWTAEGLGVTWPGEALALLALFAVFALVGWIAVLALRTNRIGAAVALPGWLTAGGSAVRNVWTSFYELLVDDGLLAGAVIVVLAAGAFINWASPTALAFDALGFVVLALIVLALVTSLLRVVRPAEREAAQGAGPAIEDPAIHPTQGA